MTGEPGFFFGESGVISYVLKHLYLIVLTILKPLHGLLDHIFIFLNLLCLNDSLVGQGISKYMLRPSHT